MSRPKSAVGVCRAWEPVWFGYNHSSGWHVAFCDRSIHFISYDVDWHIHCDLGNGADGNVADVSAF
jgi:hypothetical protein